MLSLTSTGPTYLLVCHKHQSGDKWMRKEHNWDAKRTHMYVVPTTHYFCRATVGSSWVHAGLRPTARRSLRDAPFVGGSRTSPRFPVLRALPTIPSSSRTAQQSPRPMTGRSPTPRADEPHARGSNTSERLTGKTGAQPHTRERTHPGSEGGPTAGEGQAAVVQGAQPPQHHA